MCETDLWVSGPVQKPMMKWTLVLIEDKEGKVASSSDAQGTWLAWLLHDADSARGGSYSKWKRGRCRV